MVKRASGVALVWPGTWGAQMGEPAASAPCWVRAVAPGACRAGRLQCASLPELRYYVQSHTNRVPGRITHESKVGS